MSIWGAIGSIGGSLIGNMLGNKQQKKFAQNQVQWRVADAQKAGVHPLAALGFQGQAYNPVALGDLGNAGQNLGNAIQSGLDGHTRQLAQLQLERAGLENDLLRTQIKSTNATRQPGAVVYPGRRTAIPGQPATSEPPAPEHSGLRGGQTHRMGLSDAQKFEDRYGDIVQEIAGVRNLFDDWAHTNHGVPFWDYLHLESQRRLHGRDYGRHYRHR